MPSDTLAGPARHVTEPGAPSLGLILPTFPQHATELPSAATLAELSRRAETVGARALWVCDHIFWHGPALEALSALGVAAAATSRAAIGTCILQLPLRHAPSVAKEAASLDHLSGGRLVLGVGVGTHAGEYQVAGVAFTSRGRRLDEGIDSLRRSWRVSPGQRYTQLPAAGPIPVWVGGSSESALRRAARRGDGWIPLFIPPDEYGAALRRLDKETERVGRDPATVARATVAFVSVGGSSAAEQGLSWMASLYGLSARSFERHLVAGSALNCAQAVARFVEAGAQHVAVFVTSDDPLVQFEDLAGEFAGLIASRSALATGPAPMSGTVLGRHEASRSERVGEMVSSAYGTQVEDQVWR
ncbi:MAG TPA: LLM class flavin-dependent oxidoreductase [Acidimicrobiales bacterium]|nr:LLM class flavin-dependent oxidoreductase [Acidimicrobiales bacterium]